MITTDIERAAHAATVALADFDRAGIYEVLQTVPALAQALRELLAAVTAPTPPADDVREALDRVIRRHWVATPGEFRNALLAAFEVRPRGTVTDAEVEAGAIALHAEECGDDACDHILNEFEASSRAVLEAAREAGS